MIVSAQITEIATARSMRLIARAVAAGRLQTVVLGRENLPAMGPLSSSPDIIITCSMV